MTLLPDPTLQPGQILARGVCRHLLGHDFACIEEFIPERGKRVDVMALGPKGDLWVIECKSSRADYTSDTKWQGYLNWCDRYFWAVDETFPTDLLPEGTGLIVADGYDAAFIRESMELERDQYLTRLSEGQRIFKSLGDATPAFGMIGTLVGLVQMLANMDDPSAIGPAMAVALLTTLYGAVLANLVCLPIADKLTAKLTLEEINQTLIIDGIMSIRDGKSPNIIREMLFAYLPETQRGELVEEAA